MQIAVASPQYFTFNNQGQMVGEEVSAHALEIALDLFKSQEVLTAVIITTTAITFGIAIRLLVHWRDYQLKHFMMGSELCLSGILLAAVQLLRLAHPNLKDAPGDQFALPVVLLFLIGSLFLLFSVNIERVAHESETGNLSRFAWDTSFGALVTGTAIFLLT